MVNFKAPFPGQERGLFFGADVFYCCQLLKNVMILVQPMDMTVEPGKFVELAQIVEIVVLDSVVIL